VIKSRSEIVVCTLVKKGGEGSIEAERETRYFAEQRARKWSTFHLDDGDHM
jgi:hypothetical protein